jgi:predicted component of type VI protein secretion system
MPFSIFSGARDWTMIHPLLFWPGVIVISAGNIIYITFLYLMPNGRFSPRWAYIPMACGLLLIFIMTLDNNGAITVPTDWRSPLIVSVVILVLLSIVFQIYRYIWDTNPVERQQTKWIILGVGAYFSSVIVWIIVYGRGVPIPNGEARLLANLAGTLFIEFVAVPLLPIAITIAILRYNLWGIDVIIRKTLLYLFLSGTLALVYFGMVILLQSVFNTVSEQQSPIVIVIVTLVIAALFNPLRTRLQTFIDRRFYRQKYDAQQILAQFAQTARDEVAIDALQAELVRVVQETMQPDQINVWLRDSLNR